ncbi:MAG: DUF4364 family protein [Clostridia bacterium]|nr:DUF4364 family protein [Clostridia bacterium]
MLVKGDAFINKLILLFVFDKMECPLSENTIIDMCCSSNTWISYMDCKPVINKLLDETLIYNVASYGEPLYTITPEGRYCLAEFYIKIPSSTREEISAFIKKNRQRYRRKQECTADYYMNKDSTYTVYLKINDLSQPLLELKFNVPNRQIAKNIYKKWEEKAGNLYAVIYENLVD